MLQRFNDKVKLIISLAHATKDITIIVHRSTEEIPLEIKKVSLEYVWISVQSFC